MFAPTLALISAALIAAATSPMPPSATPPSTVPFTIEQSGGNPRVVVMAKFNGHAMPMMVHSAAGFFSQLRHDQATAFRIPLRSGTHERYGIDRGGHVSDLGLDRGVATTLTVGSSVNRDAPVAVFEVPQARLGMLGRGWITANRVIVDYPRRRIFVSPTKQSAAARAAALLHAGYVASPMIYDDRDGTYSVRATINGITRRMAIATSSSFLVDSAFAAAAHLPHGRSDDHGSGPTGTHVSSYAIATPVRVSIGAWTSPPIPSGIIQDQYGYIDETRPADPTTADGGSLGGAFLQTSEAVVDFGTRTLFLRR